jgi:hypothetical protein
MTQLERLLFAVSVVKWRALNGRALLFCDGPYASYLEILGMTELFDEVDTTGMEAINNLDINPSTFWSLGRLAALSTVAVPFVSLDCDLVVWNAITNSLAPGGIAFTHWESTAVSAWYPPPRELRTPSDYQWRAWGKDELNAANVSLLYFGDEHARDNYVNEALRFTIGNPAQPRMDIGMAPELLYAEQRLLPLVARHGGITAAPIIDAIWEPALDRFSSHDPRFGEWDPLRVHHQAAGITHGWFHKSLLPVEDPRRIQLVADLTDILRPSHPDLLMHITGSGPE